jgi:hypothetical protein
MKTYIKVFPAIAMAIILLNSCSKEETKSQQRLDNSNSKLATLVAAEVYFDNASLTY